ncbi:MAG: SMP-30/gluconolactonase/LRE family protein [Spirochaetales bacterium]|nr:SMP-30/gluconolactonase/LRE family protein [Spirochaetales bacterium]
MKIHVLVFSILLTTACSGVWHTDRSVETIHIETELGELAGAMLVDLTGEGAEGFENICLTDKDCFVSSLSGHIVKISGRPIDGNMSLHTTKPAAVALGLDIGSDGRLYAALSFASVEEWKTKGGAVYALDPGLIDTPRRLTDDYPAINGLACDGRGGFYFTAGNFNFLHPRGSLYRGAENTYGASAVVSGPWVAYGAAVSAERILFSDTLGGILELNGTQAAWVYRKTRLTESVDDFCVDRQGVIWMSAPGGASVKSFDPRTRILRSYHIRGIGQTSSCAVRTEHGRNILYVAELKQKNSVMNSNFNGRGVLIVPLESLAALVP